MNKGAFVVRRPAGAILSLLFLLLMAGPKTSALADCEYSLVPGLSLVETYDDNIFLRSTDKTSDVTSVISPVAAFSLQCPRKGVSLSYQPGFVFYRRYSERNTVRHSANLSAFAQAGAYTRLDLSDTFYRTEEPQEPDETIYATRRTRNPYFRNSASMKVSHQFGPKDSLSVGYDDSLLDNKDPLVEDSRIHTPHVGLSYWFDVKNGLEWNGRYSIGDYDQTPDFKQNSDSLAYTHLLSEESSVSVNYSYTGMNYDLPGTDYVIHSGNISCSTILWRHYAVSAGLGYYTFVPDRGDTSDGLSYNAALSRAQLDERWSLSAGVQGGYRQELSDAENLGFVQFWSANGATSYLLLPSLTAKAGLSYREDKFTQQADRLDTVWSATAGLAYSYRDWLTLSLNGSHMERDSSVGTDDYDDNQVTLAVSVTSRGK